MTYKINKTNGDVLVEIADGTTNTDSTSITLIGKNATNFGEALNENFVKLLENFSSTLPPELPIVGQLWYNNSTGKLLVFDGTAYRAVGAPYISPLQPNDMKAGDIWIDSNTDQTWIHNGLSLILLGPEYTRIQGQTGVIGETVIDTNGKNHTVGRLQVGNKLVGIFSYDDFMPQGQVVGYTDNKRIQTGLNVPDDLLFNFNLEIATTASKGMIYNGILKPAIDFAVLSEENVFTERLTVQSNSGIIIGAQDQTQIVVVDNNLQLENMISNKDIVFKVKTGAVTKDAITIKGSNSTVEIFKNYPNSTVNIAGDLNISGNFTIAGETTVVESTTLLVTDKNIELASSTTPTDIGADQGGIILHGTTDKTILYTKITDSWDLSEHLNIETDKEYKIGNQSVLSTTALGTTVVNSNLETLGTLESLQLNNGLSILENTISNSSGNLTLNIAGNVDINNKKLINVASPTNLTDAANKEFVEATLYKKDLVLSMDTTGITTNEDIAAILDLIAPFYDPVTNPYGMAAEGSQLRLHSTKMQVTNGNIYPVLSTTYVSVDKNGGVNNQTVTRDVAIGSTPGPTATITVQRENLRFKIENGKWKYQTSFAV